MTCQGKRCVFGGTLEQSRSSEVEVEVEVGLISAFSVPVEWKGTNCIKGYWH